MTSDGSSRQDPLPQAVRISWFGLPQRMTGKGMPYLSVPAAALSAVVGVPVTVL